MKILSIFVSGVAYAEAQTACAPSSEEEMAYRKVLDAMEAFAVNSYQEVRSEEAGNVVVSPSSAAVVLALTWFGANGRTAQQSGDVSHSPLNREIVAEGFRQIMETLPTANNQTEDDPLLQSANRLFVQNGYSINEAFLQTAVKDFKSGVENVDFGDPENARNIINQWVANNTDDIIQDLIPEDFLSDDTRLVLVNAILFMGMWSHPFDETQTENRTFYLSESEQVNVPTMHGSFRLEYSESPDFNARVLRLPYSGMNIESDMSILSPNEADGLEPSENNLGQLAISNIQFEMRQVDTYIPLFRVEETIDLREISQRSGIIALFNEDADLNGISNEPSYASGAVQKAYIEVNENGTVAAAATAVVVDSRAVSIQNAVFQANRPFLFVLRIDKNIAFIGRLTNPDE